MKRSGFPEFLMEEVDPSGSLLYPVLGEGRRSFRVYRNDKFRFTRRADTLREAVWRSLFVLFSRTYA